jgi:hypothetical protein
MRSRSNLAPPQTLNEEGINRSYYMGSRIFKGDMMKSRLG